MQNETPAACFYCCNEGGGYYKPYEGETNWHIGLTQNGQAQFACEACAPLLYDARPLLRHNTRLGNP